MMRKLQVTVLLFLFSTIAALAEPATGRWETNYGPIEMTRQPDGFTGTYAYKNKPAFLAGRPNDNGTYRVIWVQEISEVECLELKQGSPFWGTARFIFRGDTFQALWNYCDRRLVNRKNFRWKGQYAGP